MFFRIEERFHFKRHAPPADDGSGGAVSSGGGSGDAPSSPSSAPVESSAPAGDAQAGVDADTGEDISLRSELKASAEQWRQSKAPKPEETPQEPRKPGETPLHDSPAAQSTLPSAPTDASTTEAKIEDAPVPDPVVQPNQPTSETPAVIKVGGEEYAPDVLQSIVQFAKNADTYLRQEKSNFDKRVSELKSSEAKIQERLSSPNMVLLNFMAENPELRDKFYEMAVEAQPEIAGQYDHAKTEKTISELKKEIEELKGGFKSKVKSDEDRIQTQQQAQRQQEINSASRQISDFEQSKAKELNIDSDTVKIIEDHTAMLINTGKLKPDVKAITDYIDGQYQKHAAKLKAAEDKARNAYLGEKRGLPPPPPTGGGATRVTQPRVRTFAEAEENLRLRMNSLG